MRSSSMLYRFLVAGCTLLFSAGPNANAETRISGTIHKISFEASGNPYVVEQDILIPPDVEITIKEGCVLLFKPFTTLTVQGKLVVEGTPDKPVVFTSIYDSNHNQNSKQNANPFDWNGLVLTGESGGTIMRNFVLGYSVFGVKAQTQKITIRNGLFRQNGQYHFTINDRAMFVQDDIPFTHSPTDEKGSGTTVAKADPGAGNPKAAKTVNQEADKKDKTPRQKRIFRYTCLGVGIAGVSLGTAVLVPVIGSYFDLRQVADKYSDVTSARDRRYPQYTLEYNAARANYDAKVKSNVPAGIVLESLGVLGLLGFGLTYAF